MVFTVVTLWRIGSFCSKQLWMLNHSLLNGKLAFTLEHLEMKMNGESEKGVDNDTALHSLRNLLPLILTAVLWGSIFIPTLQVKKNGAWDTLKNHCKEISGKVWLQTQIFWLPALYSFQFHHKASFWTLNFLSRFSMAIAYIREKPRWWFASIIYSLVVSQGWCFCCTYSSLLQGSTKIL